MRLRILIIAIAIIAVVPLACIAFVASYDWNRAKPWVQQRASRALGRDVEIGGALEARWRWRAQSGGEQRFSPGFSVSAKDVRIGNPDWAKKPQFAELESLEVELKLLPLLWHRLDLPAMRLVHPAIDIEQRKDGSDNWTFASSEDDKAAWHLDVGEIAFDSGEITLRDEQRALDLHGEITRLDTPIPFGQRVDGDDPSRRREVIRRIGRAAAERLRTDAERRAERAPARSERTAPPYLFAWKATGTMHGDKVSGEGRFGGVLSLRQRKPFPVRADFDVGATSVALTGTIVDPTSPDAIDMRLWISGPNLAQLYAITGIALPNTPPYATVGRLAGRFHPHRSVMRYEDFTARVGGSDLSGTLTYRSEGERPILSGEVDSTLLQFRDLGAIIGVGEGTTRAQSADRVLPNEPFNVERWKAMDADVHFTGKRVVRTQDLPISNVDTQIRMKHGVLSLDPLRFGMAGGDVRSAIRIDSNASPPKGTISLEARKLELRRLFEKVSGLSESLGLVAGDVKLAGQGRSLGAMIGASDGALRLIMTDGRVSETLMEEAGLNLANVVVAKMRGDEQIRIDCAAAALSVNDGIAKTDLFVFDTENALVEIDGTVDLGDEHIDLTVHPHTKGLRVFSLRSPLQVRGNFEQLDVSVDKKSLLARSGGALALAVVATPLAALAPLIAPGGDNEAKSCAPLTAQLKSSPKDAASTPKSGERKPRPAHQAKAADKR